MAAVWTLEKHRVLIESDWNLKDPRGACAVSAELVLIESDWNLKWEDTKLKTSADTVLIESDWNLKRDIELSTIAGAGSINKIRLEFKDYLII